MKSTLVNIALLGQAAAFPAVRGLFSSQDISEAKNILGRSYIQSEEGYPSEEPVYPSASASKSYDAPKYPVGTEPSYPHPTTGGTQPPVYPTGTVPHPPVYPTGTVPYPPINPSGSGSGSPQPPTTSTESYPYTNTNTYTVSSGSEYVTLTTTGYTTCDTTSTGFVPTSTSVGQQGGTTYYSTYLYPTYSTGFSSSVTTGYEVHVPTTVEGGCPAATATTIYQTETVYVSAGPAVTPGPDAETYTVTDKYGSTKTIVIPGTTYEVTPPVYTTTSSEEVETKTYTVVPQPPSSTSETTESTTSATNVPPVYPTHPVYPTQPIYPTGTGSTGVVPYPTGTASYYKPSPKPQPTGSYDYGYPTEPEPSKAWYALF